MAVVVLMCSIPTGAVDAQTLGADPAGLTPAPALEHTGRRGVRIAGLRIDRSPSITLTDCHGVVIENCDLRSIRLTDCTDVRILNNTIHDSVEVGIELDECRDVLIRGNDISRVASGVYAHRGESVRVRGNRCEDVQGPMPRGQFVQFDKVTGPGNEVAYNVALNHRDHSRPEDVISVYKSRGTPDTPIDVHHNLILGDPVHGSAGKSESGSGIMLGDGGGAFQVARQNLLLSPGQVGIGVAGGSNIAVVANLVRGEASDVSNVGVYAWNQSDAPGHHIHLAGNTVHWTNAQGSANDFWIGDGFTHLTQSDNAPRADTLLRWRSVLKAWRDTFRADSIPSELPAKRR